VANPAREAWGEAFIAPQRNLVIGVSEKRICSDQGPDISDHHLWNLAKKPDKVERPDISGIRARHVRVRSLEPG
jgi:hypothetical protein